MYIFYHQLITHLTYFCFYQYCASEMRASISQKKELYSQPQSPRFSSKEFSSPCRQAGHAKHDRIFNYRKSLKKSEETMTGSRTIENGMRKSCDKRHRIFAKVCNNEIASKDVRVKQACANRNQKEMKIVNYGPIESLCRKDKTGKASPAPHKDNKNNYECLELSSIIKKVTKPSRFHDLEYTKASQLQNGPKPDITTITLKQAKYGDTVLECLSEFDGKQPLPKLWVLGAVAIFGLLILFFMLA